MHRSKPSVLLIDPLHFSRRGLRELLVRAGYRVEAAAGGLEAMVLCANKPPDVVIVDLHLPDMDGFELCEWIRHETRDAESILIATTDVTDEMERSYLGKMVEFAGGDYFLARPFDYNLVVRLLDELTGRAKKNGRRRCAGFPTRVTWPTSRTAVLASVLETSGSV